MVNFSVADSVLLDSEGKPVQFTESPHQSSGIEPIYLVLHYTAGTSLDGAVSWFLDKQARASAHLVIGRDGAVVQMVRFDRKAWHAGESEWGTRKGINAYAIGIELVNAGKLKRAGKRWLDWVGNVIPDDEVMEATHQHESQAAGWQIYPKEQMESAIACALALNESFHFEEVLGHDDIAPRRKVDPGPAFPMLSFKSRVLGRE